MLLAIKAVKEVSSVNRAALEHGILRTTLQDRVSGQVSQGNKSGPKCYFSKQEDNELCDFWERLAMAKLVSR